MSNINNEPVKKKGGCLKSILIGFFAILRLFVLIGIFTDEDGESTQTQGVSTSSNSNSQVGKAEPTTLPFNFDQFKDEHSSIPTRN